jgi:lipopolysaccharide export system permease protein
MIFTMIWERYFLREVLKLFSLFLICFYGLYVLIDYASHTSALPHHQTQIEAQALIRYYLFVFSSRADLLLPLALLIATIKTLCTLNQQHEIVALMAGGLKIKTLLRPFIFLALLCTALLFLNEQFLLPGALKKLRKIEESSKHRKRRHKSGIAVHHLILEDGTLFLFQDYDSAEEKFFDTYWIRSLDEIYRIKQLSPYQLPPTGYFVDHLVRQPSGELIQKESWPSHVFPNLTFNKEILQSTILDSEALSLTEIWQEAPSSFQKNFSEKESKLLTVFHWKWAIPWLCLFAVLAPAPFCLNFSRQLPVFFIYICGIFGLIAFYMFMDAMLVMAKRQVMHPIWAIWIPFSIAGLIFGWRYAKLGR